MSAPVEWSRQTCRVKARDDQKTIASILKHRLTNHSWRQVKQLIVDGRILVNGRPCNDPAGRLKQGQRITILSHPCRHLAPGHPAKGIAIHFEDPYLLVVEKPAGLTTVRHREEIAEHGDRAKYLPPSLSQLLPVITNLKRGRRPPFLSVHRLDKQTSGLVTFAKDSRTAAILGGMFRDHDVERVYTAIVHGVMHDTTIRNFLLRNRGDGLRGSHPSQGQSAVTHVKLLEDLGRVSVVQCTLETGRTHQIRIHLAEAGHPVCGDRLYGKGGQDGLPALDRLALHAGVLSFVHPCVKTKRLRFRMQLPPDLKKFLKKLRRTHAGSSREGSP